MRTKTQSALSSWVKELEAKRIVDDPDAMTTADIAKHAERGICWAQRYVKREMLAGRLVRTTRLVNGNAVAAYKRVK